MSPEKPGVHDPATFRRPTVRDAEQLTARRAGVMLVTLAPEQVRTGSSRNSPRPASASRSGTPRQPAQTKAALAEGLTGFTHLFNAMRLPTSREPGPIVAGLETPDAWFGMIVDGHHVDPAMLRLALRGVARPMLVTDAMPTVGGAVPFTLYDQEISVWDGRCMRADGSLAGAHLDMASAVRNCVELLGVPLSASPALCLCGAGKLSRPRRFPRQNRSGLSCGSRRLRSWPHPIHGTWVAGRPAAPSAS